MWGSSSDLARSAVVAVESINMEISNAEEALTPVATSPSTLRQVARFALHVLAVYAIVNITTMWLAGFVHGRVLPLIQHHPPTISGFQFAFSHLFVFSFYPAFAVAFIYAHWYGHKIAYFVWAVPLLVLAYKFLTFPSSASVLEGGGAQFASAFHQYFAGNFIIAEFTSYKEMFQMIASNPDMPRGMAQYQFTAPLYAGIGYGFGTLLGLKLRIPKFDAALESLRPSRPLRK
jgi:hypothetical protein